MSDSINEFTKLVTEFRDKRDWKQFHTSKDMLLSLMLEVGELVEHSQWKTEEEFQSHLAECRQEIGEELADILYWVLLISHDFEIDLPTAFLNKLEKNKKKYPADKCKGSAVKYDSL